MATAAWVVAAAATDRVGEVEHDVAAATGVVAAERPSLRSRGSWAMKSTGFWHCVCCC